MALETTIRCPADGTLMQRLRIGTISVDHCARCGGIWLDAKELAAVLAAGQASEADSGPVGRPARGFAPGGRFCPRDKKPLAKTSNPDQPHVELDLCRACGGVFLDSGELTDLSELTLRERLRKLLR